MAQPEEAANPRPRLVPLTPEARDAATLAAVPLERMPFRVGRDLRDPQRSSRRLLRERRRSRNAGTNDLYLHEQGPRHRLSRQHLLIGKQDARFYLEDRRSACGTLVEGEAVGGRRKGGRRWLSDGDVIIIGGNHSPFVFKFVCSNGVRD